MVRIVPRRYPDKREFRAVWADLEPDTRRRVSAAAVRGRALEDPAEAGLAAGLAHHHPARGPLMIALLALGVAFVVGSLAGWLAGDGGGSIPLALILLTITALNALRFARLRRAERLNAAVLDLHTDREEEPSPGTPSST